MMTRKSAHEVARLYGGKVFYVGYGGLEHLLREEHKIGYNSGTFGWNWSAYEFRNNIIITGYRNLTGAKIPEKLARQYNALGKLAAEKITADNWEMSRNLANKLIARMIREVERASH